MIERTFGSFEGSIDPVSDTLSIRGTRFGWRGQYCADQIPSQERLYKRLVKMNARAKGYQDVLDCLRWAKRVLEDG